MKKIFTLILLLLLIPALCSAQSLKAKRVRTDTTNFDNILSNLDDNVQKALKTINDVEDDNILALGTSYSVRDVLQATLRNGIYAGLTITQTGGLNISWTEGVVFVDDSVFAVNSGSATLSDNATSYLYCLKDNAALQVSTTAPTGEYALVSIINTYNSAVHNQFDFPLMAGELRENIWKHLDDIHPTIAISGLTVSEDIDATNANDFTVASGSYYVHVLEKTTVSSTLYSAGADHTTNNTETFYHTAGSWTEGASRGVDFAYWDNGTDLTAVDVSKWYCGFVYLEEDDTPIYVYPQSEESSKKNAVVAAITYPPQHEGFVIPLARFVFRGSASDFTNPNRALFVDIRPFHGYAHVDIAVAIQNVFQTVTADAGSTTADEIDDILTLSGTANQISTSITGDTVTFSTPQDIAPSSSPTFVDGTFTGTGTFGTLIQTGAGNQYLSVISTDHFITGIKLQRSTWLTDAYTDYALYNSGGNLILDSLTSNVTTTILTYDQPSATFNFAGHIWQTGVGNSVFIGERAGENDDLTSNYNVFIGKYAGVTNTSGDNNVAIGGVALFNNDTGTCNTAVGAWSLDYNNTGDFNIGIGTRANYKNQEGSNNTIIGYEAGHGPSVHSKSGNVFIGYQAGYYETGSNKLYIDNSSTTAPLIYGDFSTDELTINGALIAKGNFNVLKADPESRLTDTGDSEYTRITRSDTDGKAVRYNRCLNPGGGYDLDFGGTNEYLSFDNVASDYPISVSYWVRPADASTTGVQFMLYLAAGKWVAFGCWSPLNTYLTSDNGYAVSDAYFSDNTWTHVVMVQTAVNDMVIYIDNVDRTTSSSDKWGQGTASAIARRTGGAANYFTGRICDFSVWTEELSANDVADLYNSGDGLYFTTASTWPTDGGSMGDNLAALWHFNEGIGVTAADSSGNSKDGTLNNMEEADWTTGVKALVLATDTEVQMWSSEDGTGNLEEGIQTFGDPNGRTVLEGQTIRFNIGGVEKFQIDKYGDIVNDIFMKKSSAQGYIRAYDTTGVDYIGMYHDGTDGVIGTNAGDLWLSPATGLVGIGIAPTAKLTIANKDAYWNLFLNNTGTNGADFFLGTTNNSWGAGGGRFCISTGTSADSAFCIDGVNHNTGVYTINPTGQLHVDQKSSTGAKPVLRLDQADVDDTFVDFIGASAADGTRSISSDTTEEGAKFGAIQIEINGVTKWIRVYDDHS